MKVNSLVTIVFMVINLLLVEAVAARTNADTSRIIRSAVWEKPFNPDSCIKTQHKTIINGRTVVYEAVAGTLPVKKSGATIAGVFYVYYKRDKVKSAGHRPIIFFFNGGYGQPAIWLHMGFAGPRIAKLDAEGNPIQPLGTIDNSSSLLDVADLVFVDPVGTGYSKGIGQIILQDSRFFNEDADEEYLANWIALFLSRYDRWLSPKYLVGESSGGRRVAGLTGRLAALNIHLNGVVLLSSTSLADSNNINFSRPVIDDCFLLPYYASIAWYNNLLSADLQSKTLEAFRKEVEDFTYYKLLPAILRIGFLNENIKSNLATNYSRYTSIPRAAIRGLDFEIDSLQFFKLVGKPAAELVFPPKVPPPANWSPTRIRIVSDIIYTTFAAHYYHLLQAKQQSRPLEEFALQASRFAIDTLLPVIAQKESKLDSVTKSYLSRRISFYTGLGIKDIYDAVLDPVPFLYKRVADLGIGRLGTYDLRYNSNSTIGDFQSMAFAIYPAFFDYIQTSLHYNVKTEYGIPNEFKGWGSYRQGDLGRSIFYEMAENPFLHIMLQGGYYDQICPFLSQSLNGWQMDPTGRFKDRISIKFYQAGHMFYAKESERIKSLNDLRKFIIDTIPIDGKVVKLEPLSNRK